MGDGTRIQYWEDLWWVDQPLCSQFQSLFKIIIVKNLNISWNLRSTYHFSWNLNVYHNLSDLEIEDLERLMPSLSHLNLSSFGHDARV